MQSVGGSRQQRVLLAGSWSLLGKPGQQGLQQVPLALPARHHTKQGQRTTHRAFCRAASGARPRDVSGGCVTSARQATVAAAATSSLLDSPPSSCATPAGARGGGWGRGRAVTPCWPRPGIGA